MQRSRKALLQRRIALEKIILKRKRLYKVSLSLVFVLWGLIFLLNLWMGHGCGYRDGEKAGVGEVAELDARGELKKDSFSYNASVVKDDKHYSKQKYSLYIKDSQVPSSNYDDFPSCNYNNQEMRVQRDENMGTKQCPTVEENKTDVVADQADQCESTVNILSNSKGQSEVEVSGSWVKTDRETQKGGRLSRLAPPALEEFKAKAINLKGRSAICQPSIRHRVEPGGREYNYAAASKGAKVLDYNKEAKGASNILDKDKDKYLRNPCSAEGKFVVIELSEETLVDTIEIVNFEHYSSNLKDFELHSSLVYPTESWRHLGRLTAANVKHAQRFTLSEPKWARYLKLNLVSHYGTEFYCTLSTVEVYGVDAVERMLEDLISFQDDVLISEKVSSDHASKDNSIKAESVNTEPSFSGEYDLYHQLQKGVESTPGGLGAPQGDSNFDFKLDILNPKHEVLMQTVPDPVIEIRPQQGGRMPGDTVLKILMQKVRSLELNFSVLERYLEELNSRYGNIFNDLDSEISEKDLILEQIRTDIKNLLESKEVMAKDISELQDWKYLISSQLDQVVRDNILLRLDVARVQATQIDAENNGLAVLLVGFAFGSLAVIKLFIDQLVSICRIHESKKFCRTSSAWHLLLLSSSIVCFILFT